MFNPTCSFKTLARFLVFIAFLGSLITISTPVQAREHLVFKGTVTFVASLSDDLDHQVPHYADFSGHRDAVSLRESAIELTVALAGVQINAAVDFMGPGIQLVELSAQWQYESFTFLAGKAENLVATSEQSLFYDGYFTSGGIQTGSRANQNQLRITWKPSSDLSLAVALTDEKAVSGGTDGQDFQLDGPALEASARHTSNLAELRIATHRGQMRLETGERFRPSLLISDLKVHLPFALDLYFAAYRKQAGSQFVPLDPILDYIRTPSGRISEVQATGSMAQLILDRPMISAWIGIGEYRISDAAQHALSRIPETHVLVRNERLSAGICWKPTEQWQLGLEFATFSSDHLESGHLTHGAGSIFVCRLSRYF